MTDNSYLGALAVLRPDLLSSIHQQSLPQPANQYGFPQPGEQSPSPVSATNKYYFTNDTKWKAILEYGDFDDIVIGTGFCGLAYIDQALKLDPKRRILVLERGALWLMSHFQNLPLPFDLLLNNTSETYPWILTSQTFHGDLRFVHGSFPFFGGRSPFWSAWSPRPPLALLRKFPQSLKETAKKQSFWDDCNRLLNVVQPSQLYDGEYQALQKYIEEQFGGAGLPRKEDVGDNPRYDETKPIPSADYGEASFLSVGKNTGLSKLVFEKFSTPGPLLKIVEHQRELALEGTGSALTIATDVVVERFHIDDFDQGHRADVLYTSCGALSFPNRKKPNIILATGAMPASTLVLNSVKKQEKRAGSRLSGHFLTHINARFPLPRKFKDRRATEWETRKAKEGAGAKEDEALETAAYYLAGRARNGLQYHGDITILHLPLAEKQQEDASRLCPDFFSTPTKAQFRDSKEHIIVACVMLGELDENSGSNIEFLKDWPDKTTNIKLHVKMSDKDKELRTVMYDATFEAINVMAGDERARLQYWHDNDDGTGIWHESKPSITKFQMPGIVHETSSLFMDDTLPTDPRSDTIEPGPGPQPSVDRNYRVYGTGNVYATGAAIFPTSASWNPTLTMCGYTQDLATKLYGLDTFRRVFCLSLVPTLANHDQKSTENPESATQVLRQRVNDVLGAFNPVNRWNIVWGPAVKHDTTAGNISCYVVHHPLLRFEDGSLHPTYVIVVSGTPGTSQGAFVADFDTWTSNGSGVPVTASQQSVRAKPRRAYIDLVTAQAVNRLLTTESRNNVSGVNETLLRFLDNLGKNVDFVKNLDDPDATRIIITGHSIGGVLAPVLALALVSPKPPTTVLQAVSDAEDSAQAAKVAYLAAGNTATALAVAKSKVTDAATKTVGAAQKVVTVADTALTAAKTTFQAADAALNAAVTALQYANTATRERLETDRKVKAGRRANANEAQSTAERVKQAATRTLLASQRASAAANGATTTAQVVGAAEDVKVIDVAGVAKAVKAAYPSVLPAGLIFTYPIAGPRFGNDALVNLFTTTFPLRRLCEVDSYKSWNVNLVNTRDVVPPPFRYNDSVDLLQNLQRIPDNYDPSKVNVQLATHALPNRSGVIYQSLPGQFFTAPPPRPPPPGLSTTDLEDFGLKNLEYQHVRAYINEVGFIPPLQPEQAIGDRGNDVRFDFPDIAEFESKRQERFADDA